MPGISMMEPIFCMRQIGFMPRILIMEPIFCIRQIEKKFSEWVKKSNVCMRFIYLEKEIGIN